MNEPRWLLDQTGVAVHSVVLEEHGRAPGIRDEDMLASAPNRPVNKYTCDSDATLFQLAAAYSFGLAKNHPFVDGNKRVALLAGTLFFDLNGYSFTAEESDTAFFLRHLQPARSKRTILRFGWNNTQPYFPTSHSYFINATKGAVLR